MFTGFPPELAKWSPTVIIITSSVIRAMRIGYNAELYAISACFYIPIIIFAIAQGDIQVVLRNIAYCVVCTVGAYRWRIPMEMEKEKELQS